MMSHGNKCALYFALDRVWLCGLADFETHTWISCHGIYFSHVGRFGHWIGERCFVAHFILSDFADHRADFGFIHFCRQRSGP